MSGWIFLGLFTSFLGLRLWKTYRLNGAGWEERLLVLVLSIVVLVPAFYLFRQWGGAFWFDFWGALLGYFLPEGVKWLLETLRKSLRHVFGTLGDWVAGILPFVVIGALFIAAAQNPGNAANLVEGMLLMLVAYWLMRHQPLLRPPKKKK